MIEGLESALAPTRERAVPELVRSLTEVLGAPGRLVGHHVFKRGVHRLEIESRAGVRSVVVKRLGVTQARRNELVYERWLPAACLDGACPALLGRAAEPAGSFLWHVYEDLGDAGLDVEAPDSPELRAAVALVGALHVRMAHHPMLGEARSLGGDLGVDFFDANVRDAIHALERLVPPVVAGVTSERADLCSRLRVRLGSLAASVPARCSDFRRFAGPETLLHGDLWTTNVIVRREAPGLRAALIDWDHAGAGPASYDLSTFLLRFPEARRHAVLEQYRETVAPAGFELPDSDVLNVLFETAECGRYANRLSWLALALLEGGNEWVWEKLGFVEEWFDALRPILPGAAEGRRIA